MLTSLHKYTLLLACSIQPATSCSAANQITSTGYIGRFLAHHIHSNDLASTLRVVDKQLPELAQLAPEHKDACSAPNFIQADASRPQSLPRIFDLNDNGKQFDYVFNCGGETRHSQEDEVYRLRSYDLSLNVGREAAKRGVKAFVELSTGTVYDPKREPRKESDKVKPSMKQSKWKLAAEEDLSKISGLPLVILRLAHVYGPYTGQWMGTQLALARVYQEIDKDLKWLWGGELRTATVHVDDVVRACWAAAEWKKTHSASRPGTGASGGPASDTSPDASTPSSLGLKASSKGPVPGTSVFNIVDGGNTNQGTIAAIFADVFGIQTGFQGTLINTFARMNLEHVVDDVNDETLDPWAELQEKAGILAGGSSPLTPFMEKELLRDADLSLDGSLFERTVGFKYVVLALR